MFQLGLPPALPTLRESEIVVTQGSVSSMRPWRVLHAGVFPAAIFNAQQLVGMRPRVMELERSGGERADAGVLGCWRDFRRWLHVLRSFPPQDADIFHVHELSVALAALRGAIPVVFQFSESVHDTASRFSASRSLSWAERFVLSRAAAVVVDCTYMKELSVSWGAPEQNVFLVPEPVEPRAADIGAADTRPIIHARSHCSVFSAVSDLHDFAELLAAMALIAGEIPGLQLVVEATSEIHASLSQYGRARRVGDYVRLVSRDERSPQLGQADLVIALPPRKATSRNRANLFAAVALAHGCALLAADCVANREVSPSGAGCFWYKPGDGLDLARRCSMLAATPGLRRNLGAAGRQLIHDTRGVRVVGERFDHVYRHACRHSNTVRLAGLALMPACL